jgi:hypothetical protein
LSCLRGSSSRLAAVRRYQYDGRGMTRAIKVLMQEDFVPMTERTGFLSIRIAETWNRRQESKHTAQSTRILSPRMSPRSIPLTASNVTLKGARTFSAHRTFAFDHMCVQWRIQSLHTGITDGRPQFCVDARDCWQGSIYAT